MPWDETDDYIRSGHKDANNYSTCRTMDISVDKGIKALDCKRKDNNEWEIQSYLFTKDKGWTMAKAKDWFASHENYVPESMKITEPKHPDFTKIHSQFVKRYGKDRGERFYYAWLNKMGLDDTKPYAQKESFKWASTHLSQTKEDPDFTYWKSEVAFPVASMNLNVYTEDELKASARTIIGKPVNMNHVKAEGIEIVDAEYEDGAVETLIKVPRASPINQQIADGLKDDCGKDAIIHASIEGTCMRGTEEAPEGIKCNGLVFTGLALLTKEVLPGIPLTRFYAAECVIRQFEGMVAEMLNLNKGEEAKGDKVANELTPDPLLKTDTTPLPTQDKGNLATQDVTKADTTAPPAKSTPETGTGTGTTGGDAGTGNKVPDKVEPAKTDDNIPKGTGGDGALMTPPPPDPNVIPEPTDAILTDDGFWQRFDLYHKTHGLSRQDSFRLTALDILKMAQKGKKG